MPLNSKTGKTDKAGTSNGYEGTHGSKGRGKAAASNGALGILGTTGTYGGLITPDTPLTAQTLATLSQVAKSFPLQMNAFSGYREAGKQNHAKRGAVDTGLYNPLSGLQYDSYENPLSAPMYQAMDTAAKGVQPSIVAGSYFGPSLSDGKDYADSMHLQQGAPRGSWGSIDKGFNAAAKAAGFTRTAPSPSLPGGRFLAGDLQDAYTPQTESQLAASLAAGWGGLVNQDNSLNQKTMSIMGAPGSTQLNHVTGLAGMAPGATWGGKPGELGTPVGEGRQLSYGQAAPGPIGSGFSYTSMSRPPGLVGGPAPTAPQAYGGPMAAADASNRGTYGAGPVGAVSSSPLGPATGAYGGPMDAGRPAHPSSPTPSTAGPAYGGPAYTPSDVGRPARPTTPTPATAGPAYQTISVPNPAYQPAPAAPAPADVPSLAGAFAQGISIPTFESMAPPKAVPQYITKRVAVPAPKPAVAPATGGGGWGGQMASFASDNARVANAAAAFGAAPAGFSAPADQSSPTGGWSGIGGILGSLFSDPINNSGRSGSLGGGRYGGDSGQQHA